MDYPEAKMNVAVDFGNGLVKIYGWAVNGFRKLIESRHFDNTSQALQFINNHNDNQRKSLGLSRH